MHTADDARVPTSGARADGFTGVNVTDLRRFLVLADLEHMTDAAAVLRVPQSTLSRSLARLETELDVVLFDRTGHRLRLTEYGAVLRDHARAALADLDTGLARVRSLQDPDSGAIRLGFLGSLATWLVPEILTGYRRYVTGTTITLTSAASDVLIEMLLDDRLDLTLTGPRPARADLGWRAVRTERLCLVVPAGHRLSRRRTVRLADVRDEPFLTYQTDTGLRQITDDLCRAAGITPRVTLESSDVASVDALVAAGMGVAVRPSVHDATVFPGVVHLPLADSRARRAIGICWVPGRTGSAAVTRFREVAIDALG